MVRLLLVLVFLFILSLIPPFNLLFVPIRMMLEPKPESLAKQGAPIAQAVVDYERDHGSYPAKIADLIPAYLAKEPSKEWTIQFTGTDTYLGRRGGQPHTFVRFWFTGSEAGQWRYYPDSADRNYQLSVPGPAVRANP